jgi:hypothetical protein
VTQPVSDDSADGGFAATDGGPAGAADEAPADDPADGGAAEEAPGGGSAAAGAATPVGFPHEGHLTSSPASELAQ